MMNLQRCQRGQEPNHLWKTSSLMGWLQQLENHPLWFLVLLSLPWLMSSVRDLVWVYGNKSTYMKNWAVQVGSLKVIKGKSTLYLGCQWRCDGCLHLFEGPCTLCDWDIHQPSREKRVKICDWFGALATQDMLQQNWFLTLSEIKDQIHTVWPMLRPTSTNQPASSLSGM